MQAIESERCTALKGAPTILFDLVNHPERAKYDLSSLETILVGASVVPKDLIMKIKRELKLKSAIIGYAMTESGCSGTQTRVTDSDNHAYETIGTCQPFVEIKIIDKKTGHILERNKDGEICIRSFGVMKGYWDEPEKSAETVDKNGYIYD
jgi:fatty-acyl-CoA synthase